MPLKSKILLHIVLPSLYKLVKIPEQSASPRQTFTGALKNSLNYFLSPAPQAEPQAAGFSSGLSALPQAAGVSVGLPEAPQAAGLSDEPQAEPPVEAASC